MVYGRLGMGEGEVNIFKNLYTWILMVQGGIYETVTNRAPGANLIRWGRGG